MRKHERSHHLIFFYHPDHLGSTSYVTDADGNIAQHVEYIPYGEVFVEERNNSFSTSYLFNAKELDNETGLYYYGARYLDLTGAMWLSVDPLFEKYAGMSPYNYCAGNPVKLVDPDGRENAIYVIDLQDKNREDKIDIHKTINMANLYFENLGLNTRLYEVSSEDFNPSMMNKTDSYIVVGSYDEKQKYQGRNPMKKALDFLKKHMDTNELNYSFKDWYGGGLNSERTSMIGGKQTSEMAIDGSGAYQYAKKDLKVEPESYAAFIILHGAGHNAGYSHVLSTNIPNRPLGTYGINKSKSCF
ncbi:MAG: hypothetical protein MJZ33_04585 [Paludibacteraceae bacterium]|nr:hypothetical protein [Paludibacteraceae bacterium]